MISNGRRSLIVIPAITAIALTLMTGCSSSPGPDLCTPITSASIQETTGVKATDVSFRALGGDSYECKFNLSDDVSPEQSLTLELGGSLGPSSSTTSTYPEVSMPSWGPHGSYEIVEGPTANKALAQPAGALELRGQVVVHNQLWQINLRTADGDESNQVSDFSQAGYAAMVSHLNQLALLVVKKKG